MARKQAAQATTETTTSGTPQETQQNQGTSTPQQQQSLPVVSTSTIVNIAAHSLLMLVVPFALFFTTVLGGFDSLFELRGGSAPSKETKYYIGAALAVLGVNLVIASFVVAAFRETPTAPGKKDN